MYLDVFKFHLELALEDVHLEPGVPLGLLQPDPEPIRGQHSGHVIPLDQSEASIQSSPDVLDPPGLLGPP